MKNINKIKKIHLVKTSAYLDINVVLKAKDILEKNDFEVSVAKSCFINDRLETNDLDRANDLQDAINNPNIDAILAVRGGYGLIRIIDKIDFSILKKYPKWILGFSDITILHIALNNLKIASIHSPMCADIANVNNYSAKLLIEKLKNNFKINYKVKAHKFNRLGKCVAELIGGNLSIIYSLQASHYEINTDNKILFLEDIGENIYNIDRMFYNLKLSGKFNNLKALIIGQFTDCKADNYFSDIYSVIYSHISCYDFPCCFDFPIGHSENNYPLVCGEKYSLNINDDFVEISEI